MSVTVEEAYNDASNRICAALEEVLGVSRIDLVENQEPEELEALIASRFTPSQAELLEALKTMLHANADGRNIDAYVEAAEMGRKAIAKAEGK